MITYKDCPACGTRKVRSTVRVCEVCETWERAEQERDEVRAEVERITHNIVQTERHAVLLEQENARLRDLLNRILGDDGPDLSAYLDGHVETPSVPALQAQRSKLVDGLKEGDLRCASLLGDLEAAYRERDEARADYLAAAQAAGIVYEAEGHAVHPGPVDVVVGAIVQYRRDADRVADRLDWVEREIVRLLPYQYDNGTSFTATPGECLEHAAEEMQQLRRARDNARAELERLHRLAPAGQYTMSATHEHEIVRLGAALSRAERERDEAMAEVKRLQGLMHKAAVNLAVNGPKWGHSGDEETGTHDEDCEACALEASIAMLLSGIDQETGGEP